MESRLLYLLGRDKEKFLDELKKDNRTYNLGYKFVEDQSTEILIETEAVEGIITIGVIRSQGSESDLRVNREERGRYSSLDNQIDNLIAIADAYPGRVSWNLLKGVSNPTIRDRHMTP